MKTVSTKSVKELGSAGVSFVKAQNGGSIGVFQVNGQSITVPFAGEDSVSIKALRDAARKNRATLPAAIFV